MTNSAATATITVRKLDENDPTAIYRHYQDELQGQPCHLALELADGDLTARYNPEIGNAIPKSVYDGRTLWWSIPCLTGKEANALMEQIAALAQRVYAGAQIEWDGDNHVGVLNEDARAAEAEILQFIDGINEYPGDYQTVMETDAADWFSEGDLPERLTADTTDEQLGEIVADVEHEAHDCNPDGYTVLLGVEEYLTGKREEMRQQVREELEEVAAKLQQRDDLIRRVAKFGDSTRDIAALVGLSHTGVGKIVKREAE